MLFRNIAFLDNFSSDTDELDLSYEDRTLKIRKIPRIELQEFLLPTEDLHPSVLGQFRMVITLGENKYWLDYRHEVGGSEQAMIDASNSAIEQIERIVLGLRLFKEGGLRIAFNVRKGKGIGTAFSSFTGPRSRERLYSLPRSELMELDGFLKRFSHIAWEKKKSKGPLGIALNRFTDGYDRLKLEDRIIDYVIGLEALYLQREAMGEFGYKMAHRTAILLADKKKERKKLFHRMKKVYKLRSRIVHGGKYELSRENVWQTEDLLRDSIKVFLKTPKPNWLDLVF